MLARALSNPAIRPPPATRLAAAQLAAALLLLAGCREPKPTQQAAAPIPVRAQRVAAQTLKRTLDYAGNIRAREDAQVFPKVAGKIMERTLPEGAPVKRGEALAYIDRDEVGFTFARAPVESPLSGRVGRLYVNVGASVTPQTPVALVVDLDAVELVLNVPERFVSQIRLGQQAELAVAAWPDNVFTGQVSMISPVIDLDTRTAPVEITIPNPDHRLQPGMFARAHLVLEERRNVPVVAREAVLGFAPNEHVFVVSNQVARRRPVRLGLRTGDTYEIAAGLAPGEVVVIMGQQRLQDGAAVSAQEDPPPPPAGAAAAESQP